MTTFSRGATGTPPTHSDRSQVFEALAQHSLSWKGTPTPAFAALVGESGSGKTALIEKLADEGAPLWRIAPDWPAQVQVPEEMPPQQWALVVDDFERWNGASLREALSRLGRAHRDGDWQGVVLLVIRDPRSLKPYFDVLPPVLPAVLLKAHDEMGFFDIDLTAL